MRGNIQNILSDKSCRNIWMKIINSRAITMFYFGKNKTYNKWITNGNNNG